MIRLITILVATILLPGCAHGLFSGDYNRTVATNPITGEALKSTFGKTLYNEKREARSVSMLRNSADNLNKEKKPSPCGEIKAPESFKDVGSNAAGEYYRGYFQCTQIQMMGSIVAYATGAPTTEAGEVMRETSRAVKYAEDGMTQRVNGPLNVLAEVGKVGLVIGGYKNNSDNLRKVGVSATENAANISTELSMSTTQINGSHSNDSVGGAAGEGAGGASSSNGSNTNTIGDMGAVNITAGRSNESGLATDSGRTFTNTSATQQLDTSASGSTAIGNTDQQNAIDENNGDQNSQPVNGSNNDAL